jgi:hypothetical protein
VNGALAGSKADAGRDPTEPLAIPRLEVGEHCNPTDLVRGHHFMHRRCRAEVTSPDAPTSMVMLCALPTSTQQPMEERYCAGRSHRADHVLLLPRLRRNLVERATYVRP